MTINDARSFDTRYQQLASSPYIRSQVEKVYPAYVMLEGANNAVSLEQCIDSVAFGVTSLEHDDSVDRAVGVMTVSRTAGGYRITLRAVEIFPQYVNHERPTSGEVR